MSEKLKPCPFCGGTQQLGWPFIEAKQGMHLICCGECGAQGPVKMVKYEDGHAAAIAAWNDRWDKLSLTPEEILKLSEDIVVTDEDIEKAQEITRRVLSERRQADEA